MRARVHFGRSDIAIMCKTVRQVAVCCVMGDESNSETYEKRAWEYFLQLQPIITDVNAAAELAFRAVDAFEKQLKRRQRDSC